MNVVITANNGLRRKVRALLDLFFSLVGCTLFGFLAGLFAFKVKNRWCPACGATTRELAAHVARHARH